MISARLKNLVTLNGGVLPESTSYELAIRYAEIADVSTGMPVRWQPPVPFGQAPSRARRVTQEGDILISTVRTYLKSNTRVVSPPKNSVVSTGFAVLRPTAIDSRFLGYVTQSQSFVDEVTARSVGVSYPAINPSDLLDIRVPVPTRASQLEISDYLDHETAEIDALIADQLKLIILTEERRQAELDSAFISIGNIVPMRRFISYLTSGSRGWSDLLGDHGDPFVRITNISRKSIRPLHSDMRYVDGVSRAEGARSQITEGDLLMSITADLGSVAVADSSIAGGYTSQHVCLIRPDRNQVLPDYVGYTFLTTQLKAEIAQKSYGGTKIQLSLSDVKELPVPLPSREVQQSVAASCEQILSDSEELTVEVNRAIDLARERRAALITAAVTGQIDVAGGRRGPSEAEKLEAQIANAR